MSIEHPNAADPIARVLFVLLRDEVPYGKIEMAIERARSVQKSVPPGGAGLLACELADQVHALVN